MKEWQEQAMLIEWATLMEQRYPALHWLYHVPNGERRDVVTATKLKRMGVKAGVPDLFLPVPVGRYHGLFLEMKAKKGRPSLVQKEWMEYLDRAGYKTEFGYGFADAAQKILDYLGVKENGALL